MSRSCLGRRFPRLRSSFIFLENCILSCSKGRCSLGSVGPRTRAHIVPGPAVSVCLSCVCDCPHVYVTFCFAGFVACAFLYCLSCYFKYKLSTFSFGYSGKKSPITENSFPTPNDLYGSPLVPGLCKSYVPGVCFKASRWFFS